MKSDNLKYCYQCSHWGRNACLLFFRFNLIASLLAIELFAQLAGSTEPARSSNLKIRFEHLTVDHGLSNGVVNAILQDSKGFMWFGTQDGLNKYDGYQIIIYRHDPPDSTSLPENSITAHFEDRRGRMWIGTESSKIVRFEPASEQFFAYRLEIDSSATKTEMTGTSVTAIKTIAEDFTGALWLILQNGRPFRLDTDAITAGIRRTAARLYRSATNRVK